MRNSTESKTINHTGIIQNLDKESVTILITSESACTGCHAEGSCSMTGKEEKIVEVAGNYNVKPGDTVTVVMERSTGYLALFLGYILPLIIVIITLIIMAALNYRELIAGLISIASLLPYYFFLYLFREKINNKFIFSLKV
jgi:sigma-E factor negative regulatory protein RseC